MTYLGFHLVFNLPVLVLLFLAVRKRLTGTHLRWIAAICGIVLAVTAPWDCWAVHQRIWDFDWSRVTPVTVPLGGTSWRLPAEEYAFFFIEVLFVSLLTLPFLPRATQPKNGSSRPISG